MFLCHEFVIQVTLVPEPNHGIHILYIFIHKDWESSCYSHVDLLKISTSNSTFIMLNPHQETDSNRLIQKRGTPYSYDQRQIRG